MTVLCGLRGHTSTQASNVFCSGEASNTPARVWCARVGVCVRACVRVCVRGVRVCVRVCAHACEGVRARVWCARVGVCARGVCVCVCVRARACACLCVCVCAVCLQGPRQHPAHLRPEGNGAKTQPWPFISAPRSDSRPRCPPGCSCGPQTPSYATKLAEVTQKSRFLRN